MADKAGACRGPLAAWEGNRRNPQNTQQEVTRARQKLWDFHKKGSKTLGGRRQGNMARGTNNQGFVCLFVCLFVLTTPSMPAVYGTATTGTTFPGRNPEHTRVTAEEAQCRIAY